MDGWVFIQAIFSGPTMYHLWFLYPLLGLYLLVPVLRIVTTHASEKLLWYFTAIWFVTGPVLGLLERFANLTFDPLFDFLGGYLGYLLLGYLLGRRDYSMRWAWIGLGVYALQVAVTFWGTFVLTRQADTFEGYWYDVLSPHIVIATAFVFVGFKAIGGSEVFRRAWMGKLLKVLGGASFGIYLIHVATLEWLKTALPGVRFTINRFGEPWYSIPLITTTAFLVSFVVIWIMRKLPLVKEVVP